MRFATAMLFISMGTGILVGLPARAVVPSDYAGYLGALLDEGFYGSSAGNHFAIGGTAGYKWTPHWGAGVYLTYAGVSSSTFSDLVAASFGLRMSILAAEMNYFFTGPLEGFHVGGKLGFATFSSSDPGNGNSNSTSISSRNFTLGPALGYDFFLDSRLSLGGEANVLFFPGIRSATKDVINLLLALKYGL